MLVKVELTMGMTDKAYRLFLLNLYRGAK